MAVGFISLFFILLRNDSVFIKSRYVYWSRKWSSLTMKSFTRNTALSAIFSFTYILYFWIIFLIYFYKCSKNTLSTHLLFELMLHLEAGQKKMWIFSQFTRVKKRSLRKWITVENSIRIGSFFQFKWKIMAFFFSIYKYNFLKLLYIPLLLFILSLKTYIH